jgi:putative DNA primase/helicase
MNEIPNELMNKAYRFVKLLKNSKKAFEDDWQNTANYAYNDLELLEHINEIGNYGIINRFGNLIVVDADNKIVSDFLKSKSKGLPETFVIESSPGRYHFFLMCNNSTITKIQLKNNGESVGDVRGYYAETSNYYTTCPSSTHPDGHKYKVAHNAPIAEIEEKTLLAILDRFIDRSKKQVDEKGVIAGSDNGVRHPNMLKSAIKFYYNNYSDVEVRGIVETINKNHPGGPKEQKEIDDILRDAKEFVSKNGSENRMKLFEANAITKNKKGKITINCPNLAKLIIEENNYNFVFIKDDTGSKGELFYYDNGFYHYDGEAKVRKLVQFYLEDLTREYYKNETVSYIKDINSKQRRDIEPPVYLINVKNGIYNLKTKKLEPHDKKYYFINQIPINYNPKAICPKVQKFFASIIAPEDIPFMQEIFGYSLYRSYKFRAIFFFYGTGANGKGMTIRLLKTMVGEDSYSSVKFHKLITERFSIASLYGKMANLGGEMSGNAIKETDELKNLSGMEPVTGEKKFMGTFSFINYAKLISSCNELPYIKDKSFGWWDRAYAIAFSKRFVMGDGVFDPDIYDKITTESELEGVLLWSIRGLQRLIKNKKFSKEKQENAILSEIDKLRISERLFMDDYLVLDESSKLVKDVVYSVYKELCKRYNIPIKSLADFTRSMTYRHFYTCRLGKDRKHGYRNVRWKDSEDQYNDGVVFDVYVEPYKDKSEVTDGEIGVKWYE